MDVYMFFFSHFISFYYFILEELVNSFLLISGLQQSDLVIYVSLFSNDFPI